MQHVIRVPGPEDRRKKHWRKHLTSVDRKQSSGYAFAGEWLRAGELAELPEGAFLLAYDEPGSMKNWNPLVRLWRVNNNGTLDLAYRYEGDVRDRSWALAVRDEIADIVEGAGEDPRADLLAEAERLRTRLAEIEAELANHAHGETHDR